MSTDTTSDAEKISHEEAAAFLECTELRLAALLREGRLPGLKAGRHWVIPRRAFYDAVNQLAIDAASALRVERSPPGALNPVVQPHKGGRGGRRLPRTNF